MTTIVARLSRADKENVVNALASLDGDSDDLTPLWDVLDNIVEDAYELGYSDGYSNAGTDKDW